MTSFLKDEDFLPKAIELVESAQSTIYISSFKIEVINKPRGQRLKRLFIAMSEKADSGIDVRLLTNKQSDRGHIPPTNMVALRFLESSKIKIRHLRNDRLCHAKILIIDKEKAILGSHNLSVRSCHYNFELSCFISDVISGRWLAEAFEWVWNGAINI